MSIGIGGSPAIGLGVPAREGIAGFGVAVGSQTGCLIIGHDLIGRISAIGGIAIELDGIIVGAPLSKQGNAFSFNRCQIYDILPISIGGSSAIGLSIPAGKGVARFGIAVGCQIGRRIIDHTLDRRAAAIGGVAVELNGIAVGPPLGVQGDFPLLDRCQITDILPIGIRRSAAIGLGIPAGKGITRFGIAVDRQAGCLIIGHALVGRIATVGGIAVELDSIIVGAPLSKQGNAFSFNRCQIYDILPISIGGSSAIGLSIPAGKGVACFGVAVGGQIGRLIIGHDLI